MSSHIQLRQESVKFVLLSASSQQPEGDSDLAIKILELRIGEVILVSKSSQCPLSAP